MTAPRSAPIAEWLTHDGAGDAIYRIAEAIFPLCRSITGQGVRDTLAILRRTVPLDIEEVESGTSAFDWTVPPEWTIREAYIENEAGERVVDFRRNALHVLNYSIAVDRTISLDALREHIFTLPDQPDSIPYRTSYYERQWGFCMAHRQLIALPAGRYRAVIDADLCDGHLTYGEYLHRGESEDEVLLSAHVCHPAMANDNCSGLAMLAHLAARLSQQRTRCSYRFLFAPGTIGSLVWLSRNEDKIARIKHGLVLSCVGDGGGPFYKKSRRGDAVIDRAMVHVLTHGWASPVIASFSPYGYDERQYCSPGFNLPVGLFQRSRHGTFPEYHTSADNLDFISAGHLSESYSVLCQTINIIENDRKYLNLLPKGEPQLGRRGLYAALGGDPKAAEKNMAMLWVLNFSDGAHSLLDIAEQAGLPFGTILTAADMLNAHGLLAEAGGAMGVCARASTRPAPKRM